MANLQHPTDANRTIPYDRGIPGAALSAPIQVIDTTGTEIALLSGGVVCVKSSSGVVAVTVPSTVRVGSMYIFVSEGGGSNNGTITLASGETWDGTNDVLTFDANGETVYAVKASSTRWYVANAGAVTFS
jgi:hypothetical protein